MAGIRGVRPFMPKPAPKPTGMFSSKGKQKQDGMETKHSALKKYALDCNKSMKRG